MEMTRERWREATRSALSEYLETKLVERILGEIDARTGAYQPKRAGSPVYRPTPVDPDGAYPDEEPGDGTGAWPDDEYPDEGPAAQPGQALTADEVRKHLKALDPGYVKLRLSIGEYRLYDGTGTYLGTVSLDVMEQLTKQRAVKADPTGDGDVAFYSI